MLLMILVLELLGSSMIWTKPILESDYPDSRSLHNDDIIDLSMIGDAIFGEPSQRAGTLLENWDPSSGVNADELGPYFGGDMLIPSPMGRNGITDVTRRWPKGIVPFVIRGNYNALGMDMIEKAFTAYHKYTCIRFVPRTSQEDYLSITSEPTGCWSAVGKTGGEQKVNLQSPGCVTKQGTPMHEFMHALGFLHEQNRHERDDFVTIRYENIKPETRSNFFKADPQKTDAFGVGYDYLSVMHYSNTSFSSNGLPTIITKMPANNLGQRDGFSRRDIEKLNLMYCSISQNKPQVGLTPLNAGGSSFYPVPASNRPQAPEQETVIKPEQEKDSSNPLTSFIGALFNKLTQGSLWDEAITETVSEKGPSPVSILGQRDGFSRGDIQKLNTMYNCQYPSGLGIPQTAGQYPNGAAQFPRPNYGQNNGGLGAGVGYHPTYQGGYNQYPYSNYPGYNGYFPPSGGGYYPNYNNYPQYDSAGTNETNLSLDYNHVGDQEENTNGKIVFST